MLDNFGTPEGIHAELHDKVDGLTVPELLKEILLASQSTALTQALMAEMAAGRRPNPHLVWAQRHAAAKVALLYCAPDDPKLAQEMRDAAESCWPTDDG